MALSTLSLRLRELLSPISFGDTPRYTALDVRSLLDTNGPADASSEESIEPPTEAGPTNVAERRDAVMEVAARPSIWTSRLGRQQVWELGRLADRLPTIVASYARGAQLEEIARRQGCLTTATVERALDVACACIAEHLNSRRSSDDRLVA